MNTLPTKPKKIKGVTREELINLTKDELVDKIIQLEAHNVQLKNIISKNLSEEVQVNKNRQNKPFNFDKCHFRRILLHVMYFGWNYQGFAVQEDSNNTIEHHLFHALTKTCFIKNRETSQYHRCGRTDKGVSAFKQVISITVRSKHPPEQQNLPSSISSEMAYCKILNRLLPKDIRAVAWMPIPEDKPEYSARFDCKKRQYKYYFPRSSLDIPAMRDGCTRLVGAHDYRNLCKMDVGNGVTEFRREIFRADIVACGVESDESTSMYCLIIEGNAFLWHQIRCIMGVLLLIGKGRETPDVVTELLQVDIHTRKPQYNMALDIPLNLFHCSYELEETNYWLYNKEDMKIMIMDIQSQWTVHNVKTTMIKEALQHLELTYEEMCASEMGAEGSKSEEDRVMSHADCLIQGVKPKAYTPLLEREKCSSLEERITFYRKKRKIE